MVHLICPKVEPGQHKDGTYRAQEAKADYGPIDKPVLFVSRSVSLAGRRLS